MKVSNHPQLSRQSWYVPKPPPPPPGARFNVQRLTGLVVALSLSALPPPAWTPAPVYSIRRLGMLFFVTGGII